MSWWSKTQDFFGSMHKGVVDLINGVTAAPRAAIDYNIHGPSDAMKKNTETAKQQTAAWRAAYFKKYPKATENDFQQYLNTTTVTNILRALNLQDNVKVDPQTAPPPPSSSGGNSQAIAAVAVVVFIALLLRR